MRTITPSLCFMLPLTCVCTLIPSFPTQTRYTWLHVVCFMIRAILSLESHMFLLLIVFSGLCLTIGLYCVGILDYEHGYIYIAWIVEEGREGRDFCTSCE